MSDDPADHVVWVHEPGQPPRNPRPPNDHIRVYPPNTLEGWAQRLEFCLRMRTIRQLQGVGGGLWSKHIATAKRRIRRIKAC